MSASVPASTLEKFNSFGDFLRFLRRRAGLTQLELSIAVGYSDAQISRLEQNLRLPDIPTIEARFAPALGLEDEPKLVARLLDLAANVRREDAPALGLSPYKGLNYFDETDADLFVGREELTARLTERLLSLTSKGEASYVRFLAIVGASGSGKSSLLRAGLVPALHWNKPSAHWPVHVITPTAQPLESLAASLTEDAGSMAATAALIDDLAREPRSLDLFIRKRLRSTGVPHLLLIIDQFEELFSLCRSETARAAFIDNLLTAAQAEAGPGVIVLALRADFYAYCANYPNLRKALSRQQEYIGAMNVEELRRAIEEPALRGRWEFEPGLVDLLLHDVGADAGHPAEPGALPLLSHALLETWQRRRGRTMTLSGYASSGGVRGAIAETAEAVFADRLTTEQQAIARRIFLRLTELGDETATGDTRRRAAINELILKPEETDATHRVLKALADARLITTGEDSAEVAHEALIREWPTLRGWLEENREALRLHRHLTEAAREWLASGHEPDGLYRGARLAQAREWAASNEDEMNALEREFLQASLAWAEQEAAEREAQRQRELEAAQKLASAENRRAEEQVRAAGQLHKRAVYLSAALAIALLMAFVALFFGAQARQAAAAAQDQQRVSFARELAAAAVSNLEADSERSILLAMQAVSLTYDVDKRWTAEAEDALRRALQASRLDLTLRGHTDVITSIAFSLDGRRLATASDDGTVKVWDAATGKESLAILTKASRGYHGLAFSPDGKLLATAGEVGTAGVWDVEFGQIVLSLQGHHDWISSVAFSPDGKHLATASEDRTVKIWDLMTGLEVLTLTGHTGPVYSVAFSPDGKRLATASEDTQVKIWEAESGQVLETFSVHRGPVYMVAYSPDGARLATAGGDGIAKILDGSTGEELITLRGHTDQVAAVAFSPDGLRLASTSLDGKVKVWDAITGQELFTLAGHSGPVIGIDFSPDGTRLATTSFDGTARVWNISTNGELPALYLPGYISGALSPDGRQLANGFMDGLIKLWQLSIDPGTGEVAIQDLNTLQADQAPVWSLAFSPDGNRLATAGQDPVIRLWDLETGKELRSLEGHAGEVSTVVFNSDGSLIATSGRDFTIRIWDTETGDEHLTLGLPENEVGLSASIAFSPDGTRLAAGMIDGTVKVWGVRIGEAQFNLLGHNGEIWSIAYSPDGKRLASASEDRTAKVWDAATGQELFTLRGHQGPVNDIAFSPDGSTLFTAGQDATVKLWNAVTGQELKTLPGHTDRVMGLEVSPNGRWLLTGQEDGVYRFYLLQIEDLMALARTRVTRALTNEECQQYLHLSPEECAPVSFTPASTASPAAQEAPGETPGVSERVCEITDVAGLYDQFFSQLAYQGLQESSRLFSWEALVFESSQPSDIAENLVKALGSDCELIVLPSGFFFADLTRVTAAANPDQKFLIMDWSYEKPLDNLWEQVSAVDQAAFLAGYVAASVTRTGVVGTFGGVNFTRVADFMTGFVLGVDYYNQQNGAQVKVLGWDVEQQEGLFTGNFFDIEAGRKMAEQLMDDGADIILPVAGNVGAGAASAIQERGDAYLIGVDSDWVITYPEYSDILLTSIEKRADVSVVSAVQAIEDGEFTGGIHVGTLENGGVSIAPFHNLDHLVSPKVKAELEQIKAGIIAGKIKTRP